MSETRPRYQAGKHICVDCRHYQAQTDRAGWCRHEQEAVSGIEGCYGFARIESKVGADGVDVTNSICVNCTHCAPGMSPDGMKDYANAQCRLHRLIASIERLECDDFQHWTAPLQRRTDEIEIDASGVQNRQVGGDHYIRHGIQPWDIWAEYNLDPWEASALKYLLRRKGDRLTDLEKCRHYLDYLIERERATGVSDGG